MKNIKALVKIFPALLCVVVMLFCVVTLSAATPEKVVDDAGILSADEEARLSAKLESVSAEYGYDIAVVTVKSLQGKTVRRYAEDYYDNHGYGVGDTKDGVLLLVCTSSREYHILTNGRAYDIFSEMDLNSLEDAFLGDLSQGNYYESFDAYADKCGYIIKYDKRLSPVWIVISLVVGAAVAGIAVWSMSSKHKSVRPQRAATSYVRRDSFELDHSRDIFLYSHITRRIKPQQNSGGRGGSFGGGGSRGGRSGRF